ncbi:zinc ABC transporter permease AztB [Glutamicibacter sp. NPDC087344]|uniref:zinc ABC transporter permease AztB n=1 Tax=Glutamicibacter sp. NPDC087344 TaxID=3363994 RepID=UPI00382CE112
MLIEPFTTDFMLRALLGGSLVAVICAIAGTWVVIRGMAFLGEAMGHGMLPGVALAGLLGLPLLVGAGVSAVAMSLILGALQRRGSLGYDTSIGLVFTGMLSLGVIIVSHSRSFATDATAMLFGDILGVGVSDLWVLVVALLLTLAIAVGFHRAFVAVAFDTRIAATLGLRPALAQQMLVALVSLAVLASFQAVGTLLVIGLLLAPVMAARPWVVRIGHLMFLAALCGILSVVIGLTISWHLGTAAGASISAIAILGAGLSHALRALTNRSRPALESAQHSVSTVQS